MFVIKLFNSERTNKRKFLNSFTGYSVKNFLHGDSFQQKGYNVSAKTVLIIQIHEHMRIMCAPYYAISNLDESEKSKKKE